MKKVPEEYMLTLVFKKSVDREELLCSKYQYYNRHIKSDETKDLLNDCEKLSRDHINLLKDEMIKLNIQG